MSNSRKMMTIDDYAFDLPEELIAQTPAPQRDAARLLLVNRAQSNWCDSRFACFAGQLTERDVVVLNNTRVFPARLAGQREPTGGRVELFLVRELEGEVWEVLARPARRLSAGSQIIFGTTGKLRAEIIEILPDGKRAVRFQSDAPLHELLEELGETPLPPYIKRGAEDDSHRARDRERYQTVYARQRGAIAAPTAGLHFTPQILADLKTRGVAVAEITLHVGYGTFEPVRATDLSEHSVAAEQYEIGADTAEIINCVKARGGRVIAVGTTTTRALENATDENGVLQAGANWARLTITPGYRFRMIDGLLTNFHLPRSSLLVLVSTFAGYEFLRAVYAHAVAARYRFYSYGDCMLIV